MRLFKMLTIVRDILVNLISKNKNIKKVYVDDIINEYDDVSFLEYFVGVALDEVKCIVGRFNNQYIINTVEGNYLGDIFLGSVADVPYIEYWLINDRTAEAGYEWQIWYYSPKNVNEMPETGVCCVVSKCKIKDLYQYLEFKLDINEYDINKLRKYKVDPVQKMAKNVSEALIKKILKE